MNNTIFCFVILMLSSCTTGMDYQYEYQFEGLVRYIDQVQKDIFIEYEMYQNGHSLNENQAMNVHTDSLGRFAIDLKISKTKLDSIRLTLASPLYKKIEHVSIANQWQKETTDSIISIKIEFSTFELEEIDHEGSCKAGKTKAQHECTNKRYKHFEYLKIGEYNHSYLEKLTKELQKMGIEYSIIPLIISLDGEEQTIHECYLQEMKNQVESKFGVNWFETSKARMK